MLGDVVIYNIKKEFNKIKTIIFNNEAKKIAYITFKTLSSSLQNKVKIISDNDFFKADISKKFKVKLKEFDAFILIVSVNNTDTDLYKFIKELINDKNKIIAEILI